ncbi:MAG TPA: alpha/beta fold hydrolase [Nocardioidaceae bacterium]|jgi:pimeloyl-ACP methyl ester carboxylesterase
MLTRLDVRSAGVSLAVWQGPRNGPTIVFVHGYPDTHVLWDPVIERLVDRFHCVAYDVRGAGESGAPTDAGGYRLGYLRADVAAVIDAVQDEASVSDRVHLVGHDWGSVQLWDAVIRSGSDARLAGRLASFTSISGPCLEHVGAWMRSARRGTWKHRRAVLRQLLHSWYVLAFQVPVLPEIVLRRVNRRLLRRRPRASHHFAPSLPDDSVRGLGLYRANILSRREPLPGGATTDLPVQVIVLLRDPYVTSACLSDLQRWTSDLTRVELDAGHWAPYTHADEVVSLIARHVDSHAPPPPDR